MYQEIDEIVYYIREELKIPMDFRIEHQIREKISAILEPYDKKMQERIVEAEDNVSDSAYECGYENGFDAGHAEGYDEGYVTAMRIAEQRIENDV